MWHAVVICSFREHWEWEPVEQGSPRGTCGVGQDIWTRSKVNRGECGSCKGRDWEHNHKRASVCQITVHWIQRESCFLPFAVGIVDNMKMYRRHIAKIDMFSYFWRKRSKIYFLFFFLLCYSLRLWCHNTKVNGFWFCKNMQLGNRKLGKVLYLVLWYTFRHFFNTETSSLCSCKFPIPKLLLRWAQKKCKKNRDRMWSKPWLHDTIRQVVWLFWWVMRYVPW